MGRLLAAAFGVAGGSATPVAGAAAGGGVGGARDETGAARISLR